MSEPVVGTDNAPGIEELLTPLLGPAYGFALNLTGDSADAEDLVQEAALAALRGFEGFEPGTNFKAWYFKILTNCWYGRLRQRKRRPQTVDLDEAQDLYMFRRTAEMGLHSETDNPAQVVLGKLTTEHVVAAIDALPDEFRVVASLYFIQDFDYAEIAQLLECPIGTVRSRLHRSRRMLQKQLWGLASDAGIVSRLTLSEAAS